MRQCSIWVTFDDAQHMTLAGARKHLEELRGAIILKLAKQIVEVDKYAAAVDWVESRAPFFAEMAKIEADMVVIGEDDETEL
jgi:hypothetical protein